MNIKIPKRNIRIGIILTFLLSNYNAFAGIDVTGHDASCYFCSDGYATVSVKGGTPPYTYFWSNGSTDAIAINLGAGLYTVEVTDANGCTGFGEVIINAPAKSSDDSGSPPDPFGIPVGGSKDPNDITGPNGYGEAKWVSVNDVLPYTIRFENDSKLATSAVNKVVITLPIDKNASMYTFQLGNINFREYTIEVPSNSSHFFKRMDLVDSLKVFLDVTAGLDITKNQAFWIFQAYDPVSGLPNTNPDLGFLLINDSITHHGEGAVSFSIKPKSNAYTGDTIHAYADIVFDANAPLRTNLAFNIIDAHAPLSKIKSLSPIDQKNIEVSWTGKDDKGGCGVEAYTLLISANNQPYITYANGITDTSYILSVQNGGEYKLKTIASDHVKNMEQFAYEPDTTFVNTTNNFFISPDQETNSCVGGNIKIHWRNLNEIYGFYLQISADSGRNYTNIGSIFYISDSTFTWKVPTSLKGNKNYIFRAIKPDQTAFATSEYFYIQNNLHVNAGSDKALCSDQSIEIGGSPTASGGTMPYSYQWVSSGGLDYNNISNPNTNQEGAYIVNVTDALGCSNSDTIKITKHPVSNIYVYGDDTAYYLNSAKDTLYGFPEGGVFSGDGISGNIFDPARAGIGPHSIIYTYTNEFGCSASVTVNNKVLPPGNISFTGLDSVYCINALSVTLTGIPAGGIFSGQGTINNIFNPSIAGVGLHEVKYTFIDSTGISLVSIAKTKVLPLPLVSLGKDTSIKNNQSIILSSNSISSVNYLWSDNSTNDSLVIIGNNYSEGDHTVWVVVTDNNHCSNSDTIIIRKILPGYIALGNAENTTIYLYPNPTSGILNLKVQNLKDVYLKIEIVDLNGVVQRIEKYDGDSKDITSQIDISFLAAASYIFKFTYKDIEKYMTIIKQ
jgi:hypothetical protein